MNNRYNLYNLEASFKSYLSAGKNIRVDSRDYKKIRVHSRLTIKNYLSDLRHFWGWLIFKFKVQSSKFKVDESIQETISIITPNIINEYKSYLVENNAPVKTINRRLSAVRKFCSFCISQGWLKENPAKAVGNIGSISCISPIGLIVRFEADLFKEKIDQKTIKSYLDDVREFLQI